MKIVVISSGELGLRTLKSLQTVFLPDFIATDSNSLGIIEFAKNNKIALYKGNPRKGELSHFLGVNNYDVIFSINYLFLINVDVINKAKYVVNLHGSLLPKYRGRTPHVWSIINNETETGVTAHLIDEGCDTGPIILQKKFNIHYDDTGAEILKSFEKVYPIMIFEVLNMLKKGEISLEYQNEEKSTFFGQRTPNDGKINWDWQKERIRNWIRAQAYPYPGAYGFFEENKIVIDEIKFDDLGFSYAEPNGLVKTLNPIRVKTDNGVIKITKVRFGEEFIKVGKILK